MAFVFNHDKFVKDFKNHMLGMDMSFRELAGKTKVSHTMLWRFSAKKAIPNMADFVYICNVLDMNPYEYFEEEEYQLRLL